MIVVEVKGTWPARCITGQAQRYIAKVPLTPLTMALALQRAFIHLGLVTCMRRRPGSRAFTHVSVLLPACKSNRRSAATAKRKPSALDRCRRSPATTAAATAMVVVVAATTTNTVIDGGYWFRLRPMIATQHSSITQSTPTHGRHHGKVTTTNACHMKTRLLLLAPRR